MNETNTQHKDGAWRHVLSGIWRTPLGLIGLILAVTSTLVIVLGLLAHMAGLLENSFFDVVIFMIMPGIMVTGLALIPIASYLRRRQWKKDGINKEHLYINLSDHRHRKVLIGFIGLTVLIFGVLGIVGYEGYHFTESTYFCGMVCHQTMEPEYTAYKRSAHAKVRCIECHIGPGADWFVKSKISGLRQVVAMATGSYNRPIPAPVEHLRPARDTCEGCHWPEKFHGKKVKTFSHFSDSNQTTPEKQDIALHIGGRNPVSGSFEGIHWHVSNNVEVKYLTADEKRLQVARVQVKRPDGSTDEFVKEGVTVPADRADKWRVMDCIDCHNRPTHTYQDPEERVDFGLLSKRINGEIPGIRADSLTVLKHPYKTREEAIKQMATLLTELQTKRSPAQAQKYAADIKKAADYLLETYKGNVWPNMKITWGTYQTHLGHRFADEGYGCFRCHDEEHVNKSGKAITQSCDLCHDEPA